MQTYIVAKGDSLWLIARKFGVTLEDLVKANPQIKDANKIYPGNRVHIPLPMQNGKPYYTVQPGDTMWLIAKKFSLPLDMLLKANPQIVDADKIDIGQKITIPAKTQTPQNPPTSPEADGENNGKLYFIRKGDTFFNIAQRYAINLDTLILANPQIADAGAIVAGMQIYIPGFHYVKGGETLFSIAKKYGVELKTLVKINPQIKNADVIEVGDKIAIPRRANGDMAVYTVKQGDSLYKIGQKYNLTSESIANANPAITDPNRIYPGEKLAIPGPHQVQKGQSLWEIANLYGVPLDALEKANPQLEDENMIYPNTMIIIPSAQRQNDASMGACGGLTYIVRPGDTLYEIGRRYHVSVEALIRANPQIKNADLIYPGQKIEIPIGCTECICYMVKEGDTLGKIARIFDVDMEAIVLSNPIITDVNYIEAGQNLMIPVKGQPCAYRDDDFQQRSALTKPTLYQVEKSDSLYSIAAKYKITVKQILMANPQIADENMIYPGEELLLLPMQYKLYIEASE